MKYKLWCKNKKEWEKDSWVILPNGEIAWTEYGNIVGCAPPKSHVLIRSTDLKDKNGVEIYEGDIVFSWSEGVQGKGVVKQRVDGLWIMYPAFSKGKIWAICPNQEGISTVEVIGNIYENPELLERE